MSLDGYCDTCNHRDYWHGDRALGGICAADHYPNNCPCTGYTNESEKPNGPAVGAA